ncbi:MAG: type II secretion system protein N [Burkholderiaceae bacterium]
MLINLHHQWAVRLATLLLWAAPAASAVYWALQWAATPPAPAAAALPPGLGAASDPQSLARLLGAVAAAPLAAAPSVSLASRFALVGVLAGRSGGGAALIAVDGKPPKPYRIGAAVEEGLVVQSLSRGQVVLGAGGGAPAALTLDMPTLKK